MSFPIPPLERLFRVLGDQSRLRILQAVREGERSVSEILERTGLPQTLASFHLRILREAGVLRGERRGPFVYYRLGDDSLPNLLEACARYAESRRGEAELDFRWPSWVQMCQMMQTRRR